MHSSELGLCPVELRVELNPIEIRIMRTDKNIMLGWFDLEKRRQVDESFTSVLRRRTGPYILTLDFY